MPFKQNLLIAQLKVENDSAVAVVIINNKKRIKTKKGMEKVRKVLIKVERMQAMPKVTKAEEEIVHILFILINALIAMDSTAPLASRLFLQLLDHFGIKTKSLK